MTKLGRHIDVIMVRPVIPHIAGIVVGYWRNGCSYRNIAREAGLHSNTVYGIIKRFREREHFVCGRRTRRPRKTNDRDDRVLYRLVMENRRFSVHRLRRAWQPNVNSNEHIWEEIGRGLEELDPQSVNLRQLGVVVQNVRQQIPLERVQTLVSSMPRRVRAGA